MGWNQPWIVYNLLRTDDVPKTFTGICFQTKLEGNAPKLDGFDLGVGILSPFFSSSERDIMVSTILPVWDGNETWLVW